MLICTCTCVLNIMVGICTCILNIMVGTCTCVLNIMVGTCTCILNIMVGICTCILNIMVGICTCILNIMDYCLCVCTCILKVWAFGTIRKTVYVFNGEIVSTVYISIVQCMCMYRCCINTQWFIMDLGRFNVGCFKGCFEI